MNNNILEVGSQNQITSFPVEIKGCPPISTEKQLHHKGEYVIKGVTTILQWKGYGISSKNDGLITCRCDIMNPPKKG